MRNYLRLNLLALAVLFISLLLAACSDITDTAVPITATSFATNTAVGSSSPTTAVSSTITPATAGGTPTTALLDTPTAAATNPASFSTPVPTPTPAKAVLPVGLATKDWSSLKLQFSTLSATGHSALITAVLFSPDGKLAATASFDHTVKLWEIPSAKLLFTLKNFATINTLAFSPDGKWLVGGGEDGIIKIWEVATGRATRSFSPQNLISSTADTHDVLRVAFSHNGQYLAAMYGPGRIAIWNVMEGKVAQAIHTGYTEVRSAYTIDNYDFPLTFSADDKFISGYASNTTVITIGRWEISSGNLIGQSTVRGESIFSADGSVLVEVAGYNKEKEIRLWNENSNTLITTIKGINFSGLSANYPPGTFDEGIFSVALSPDQHLLAIGTGQSGLRSSWHSADRLASHIQLWDLTTGKKVAEMEGHGTFVNAMAFSPDGKTLLSGGIDPTLKIWRTSDGYLQTSIKLHKEGVTAVAFSPDGTQFAFGRANGAIEIRQTSDGRLLHSLQSQEKLSVSDLKFDFDGKLLISEYGYESTAYTSGQGAVQIWQASSGKLLTTFSFKGGRNYFKLSPDGKIVAISSDADNTSVQLWQLPQLKLLSTLPAYDNCSENYIFPVSFSPDSRQVAFGISGVWEVVSGKRVTDTKCKRVLFDPSGRLVEDDRRYYAWSDEGRNALRWLASSDYKLLAEENWSYPEDKLAIEYIPSGTINVIAQQGYNSLGGFSPAGTVLVGTDNSSNTIKLWQVYDQQELFSTDLDQSFGMNSLVVSRDGKYLLSGHSDGTAKIWQLKM